MLNEIQKKWVAALRDPSAKQGRGYLGYEDGSRCCLGVLCDLAADAGIISKPTLMDGSNDRGVLKFEKSTALLPPEVKWWAGVKGDLGNHTSDHGNQTTLSTLNDSGDSFAKIADVIESEPEGLFVAGGGE